MPELKLIKTRLDHGSFYNANLRRAFLDTVTIEKVDFSGANLSNAVFKNAQLKNVDLSGVNLQGADLRGADLRNVILKGANLNNSILMNANLEGAILESASLKNADLRLANLKRANFENANLCGIKLDGSDMRNTNLRNTDLTDVDMRTVHLFDLSIEKFRLTLMMFKNAEPDVKNLVKSYINQKENEYKLASKSKNEGKNRMRLESTNLDDSVWMIDDVKRMVFCFKEANFKYLYVQCKKEIKIIYKKKMLDYIDTRM